jgi:hypothetical protein
MFDSRCHDLACFSFELLIRRSHLVEIQTAKCLDDVQQRHTSAVSAIEPERQVESLAQSGPLERELGGTSHRHISQDASHGVRRHPAHASAESIADAACRPVESSPVLRTIAAPKASPLSGNA